LGKQKFCNYYIRISLCSDRNETSTKTIDIIFKYSAVEGWRESDENNFFWRLLDAIFAVTPSSWAIRLRGAVGSILLLLDLIVILMN